MGALKILEEMLASVKPRTQYALTVLGFSLFSATASVCSTLIAQNWWLGTRGFAYYSGVAKHIDEVDSRLEKVERWVDRQDKKEDRLARVELALWNLDGKVEVLLDRPRPRRTTR